MAGWYNSPFCMILQTMERHACFLAATILLALCGPGHAGGLTLDNGWIAEAPPVSRVQAGYLDIRNDGVLEAVVSGMSCRAFERTEFHRTVDLDGVARMEHQPTLRVAPGSVLSMRPGGLHVMLYEPKSRLKTGDAVQCELLLGDERMPVTLVVRKAQASSGHDHSHHHHH